LDIADLLSGRAIPTGEVIVRVDENTYFVVTVKKERTREQPFDLEATMRLVAQRERELAAYKSDLMTPEQIKAEALRWEAERSCSPTRAALLRE